MRQLKVVVVGAGLMGRWHAFYANRCGGRVVAIVDRDSSAASTLARVCSASPFSDIASCLTSVESDVVHICTPASSHFCLAHACIDREKHVIIEKPVTQTVEHANQLLDLAERRGVQVWPVHQFSFQKGFQRLLHMLPTLGDLVRVDYQICSAGGEVGSTARNIQVLLEILPHFVSVFSRIGACDRELDWEMLRVTNQDLDVKASDSSGVVFTAGVSLRGRPTRNELVITGTKSTRYLDFFHGYGFGDVGKTSRLAKVTRPFRISAARLLAAGFNLSKRLVWWEPAYPGLARLLRDSYHAMTIGDKRMQRLLGKEILASANLLTIAMSAYRSLDEKSFLKSCVK